MDAGVKWNKPERELNPEDAKLSYRELIGALNYLAVVTRSDISFACSYLG